MAPEFPLPMRHRRHGEVEVSAAMKRGTQPGATRRAELRMNHNDHNLGGCELKVPTPTQLRPSSHEKNTNNTTILRMVHLT